MQNGLIAAIIFAALVIGGSMTFLGVQMSGNNSDPEIAKLKAELNTAKSGKKENPTITASREELIDDDAVLGEKDAPVTLVEFSDYQCPYCRRNFTQTLPDLKKNFIDTGKANLVFRDFPLSFHADAIPAAMAAECAREQGGDDTYFQMHEKIFSGITDGSIPEANLKKYAAELSLNTSKFDTCFSSQKYKDEIQKDMTDGSRLGINGTPGFILTNGKTSKLISGAQPFSAFKAEIEAMLN